MFDRIRAFFSNSELPQAGRFQGLNYRLVTPDRPTENAPLIVYLHGAGGAGDDNLAQLKRGSGYAISRLKESAGPSFILAPQCPQDQAWWSPSEEPGRFGEAVLGVIETLLQIESIDPHRVSLVGVSMGGHGVWDLGWRYPDRWAALMPICGAVPPHRLSRLCRTPVWCFHGGEDRDVPVEGSRQAVRQLENLGAPVKYTELPGVGHSCTREVFARCDYGSWLLQQSRQPSPIRRTDDSL